MLATGPKEVSAKVSAEKKEKLILVELEEEIIDKHERGVCVEDIACQYNLSMLTIWTIPKEKDGIKAISTAKGCL